MSLSTSDACCPKSPAADRRDTTESGRISGPSDLHSPAPTGPQATEQSPGREDARNSSGDAFRGTACGARSTRCTGVR
jgi:hypothetical protein